MRILLVSQNFYPEIGSGANRIKNLYQHLSINHEVEVLTTTPNYPNAKMYQDKKYWTDEDINQSDSIIRIPVRLNKQSKSMIVRTLYYLELSLKVRMFLKKWQQEYDTIYVTSPNIFLAWAILFVNKYQGNQKVLEIRDLWPDSVRQIDKINIEPIFGLLKWLEKKMYRLADKIVINNEGFRKAINDMAPAAKILYLPNGLTDDEVSKGELSETFNVIYTGNIGFAQSFEQLTEVCHLLEDAKIEFNIIGYGVRAHELKSYIAKQNFKYIHMHNECSRNECLDLIKEHHVQVSLLKSNEVFLNVLPGKIIDSIGSETIVVTNVGGYANRLINENNIGVAIENGSSEEIVNAIINLKERPDLAEEYRKNMNAVLHDSLLWSKNIHTLEEFLKTDMKLNR